MPSSLSDCWFSNQTTPRNTNTIDFASVKVGLPKVIEINRDRWPGVSHVETDIIFVTIMIARCVFHAALYYCHYLKVWLVSLLSNKYVH